jgi:hypothetical protein
MARTGSKAALEALWAFYRYVRITGADLPEPWCVRTVEALRELERVTTLRPIGGDPPTRDNVVRIAARRDAGTRR